MRCGQNVRILVEKRLITKSCQKQKNRQSFFVKISGINHSGKKILANFVGCTNSEEKGECQTDNRSWQKISWNFTNIFANNFWQDKRVNRQYILVLFFCIFTNFFFVKFVKITRIFTFFLNNAISITGNGSTDWSKYIMNLYSIF